MIRINLQLDGNIAKAFTHKATKAGIPKAQLLRKWIKDVEFIDFTSVPQRVSGKGLVSYTLRLPSDLLNDIDEKASSRMLSRVGFLRSLVYYKLHHNLSTFNTTGSFYSLWLNGKFEEIDAFILNSPEINVLTQDALIAGIRKSNEVGDKKRSNMLLAELSHRSDNNIISKLLVSLLTVDLYTMQRDYGRVDILLKEIKENIFVTQDRYLLGLYYLYLGELNSYKDKLYLSRIHFFKALSLFDLQNHPLEITRIYLRLGRLEECLMNFTLANTYFLSAYQIAQKYDNGHYLGWFYNDYAFHFYLRGDLNKANRYINISKINYDQVRNSKGVSYNNDHKGRFLIQQDDYVESKKYLDKACSYLDGYLTENCFNYTDLFRFFIKAKYDYNSVERQLKSTLVKHKNIKPIFGSYIYNTIRYIHSVSSQEKHDAGKKLETMSLYKNYPLISNAASKTLVTKKLTPVR